MQLIDALIQGSVLFGIGYVGLMFAGFFVRTVRPAVEQVDRLSEIAGEDLLQQSEAIPAFPGDVTVTAEPDAIDLAEVEPIGRPDARCMAKAMAPEARLTIPVGEHPALEGMSIRQLKKLASEAKIRKYSNLTKDELIERLRRFA